MICRSCNRTLPARARYCVHCGAEQDLPTPIAFAAAMAGVRREAANAVYAEAAPPPRGEARAPGTQAGFPPRVDTHAAPDERSPSREGGAAPGELDSTPAYSNAPSRYRLATALIVACLVLGAVGLTAAWWLRPTPPLVAAPSTTDTAMPPALPASPPAEPAPSLPDANAAPPAPPATADTTTGAPTAEAPSSAEAAPSADPAAEAPVQITPLPAHRGASRPHAAARPPGQRPEASPAEPAAAPAPVPPTPPKQRAVAPAPPAATAAAPVDRWTRMNDEMSRCTREDFIARVICGQRVRFRYCDGYWGKVPACPGNPAPERGQ